MALPVFEQRPHSRHEKHKQQGKGVAPAVIGGNLRDPGQHRHQEEVKVGGFPEKVKEEEREEVEDIVLRGPHHIVGVVTMARVVGLVVHDIALVWID